MDLGAALAPEFYQSCVSQTRSERWCTEVMRPNPSSISMFQCTYGKEQPHLFIHPDKSSWKNAFQAIKLIQALELKGLGVCQIYNWWRPEPYNKNVGGAADRHPYGTSVDVRFCSMPEMEKGFKELCKARSRGELKAIGYYNTTGIHFGIRDKLGNTWGKKCP